MNNRIRLLLIFLLFVFVALPVALKLLLAVTAPSGGNTPASRPFHSDPALPGEWRTVDFVSRIEDFEPGRKHHQGSLAFDTLTFNPDGTTSGVWTWTRGYIRFPGDEAEGRYEIRNIGGKKYLFMEWVDGGVLLDGKKPSYYVLQQMQ